ncbi:LutC/YkgG family protein [Selenihalanaerobacter shriftii]|uniref:L-lactate dehydrogenase complex protein LldG n=1 Tax=Selenihalanaerobacter shriftii TaxID=142842 RepID=A0A1T4QQZ1_9FIRM|nr:lactate utilization protein [Selenihalanaerobacter shriftii]SKA06115.1 L-lactate dehydrogenase complex protein LldG [Selenihalanaerobacter shriftii]
MAVMEENITKTNLDKLYNSFVTKAETLTTQVYRANNNDEVVECIKKEVNTLDAKKVVGCESELTVKLGLKEKIADIDSIDSYFENISEEVEDADIGISELDIAVAKSSTLIQNAESYETRVVSMLPKTHIAVVKTKNLVPELTDAFEVLKEKYGTAVPPYLAFITGPSKTADIERTLTIGVHGPGRLVVIFVD